MDHIVSTRRHPPTLWQAVASGAGCTQYQYFGCFDWFTFLAAGSDPVTRAQEGSRFGIVIKKSSVFKVIRTRILVAWSMSWGWNLENREIVAKC